MKKVLFIAALFVLALAAQSCCVTVNCPGVASTEEAPTNDS